MRRESAPVDCGGARAAELRAKQARNLAQFSAGAANGRCYCIEPLAFPVSERQCRLRIMLLVPLRLALLMAKNRAGASERVALRVNEALDLHRHLHVAAAIEPLAGSAFIRLELGKLRLPKSEDVCLHAAELSDISNFEVKTIRDRRWLVGALPVGLCSHNIRRGKQVRIGEKASR